MFEAVAVQLGSGAGVPHLRRAAAAHMRQHRDDFAPFLLSDAGDMLDSGMRLCTSNKFTLAAQFDKYVADMESTAAWGGQCEVR